MRRATEKLLKVSGSNGHKEEGRTEKTDPSLMDEAQMVADNNHWLAENPSGRGKVETKDSSFFQSFLEFFDYFKIIINAS